MKQHPDYEKHIVGLLNNDSTSIQQTVHLFRDLIVYEVVVKRGGTVEMGKDVFQQGLVVILEMARQSNFLLSSTFKTLLYEICRRIWLKRKRDTPQTFPLSEVTVWPVEMNRAIDETIERQEQYELYRLYFAQLRPKCQTLINARNQGKNYVTISKELNYNSPMAARTAYRRCKIKLIELIRADYRFKDLS